MQVYALSLPIAFTQGWVLTEEPGRMLQELRRAVKRALSSLLAELHTGWACYIRVQAGLNSNGDGTSVFEGFDILGPDSWRHVCNRKG
jgi:hypothetical protein